MIQEFVNVYMENKEKLRNAFSKKHPDDYEEIVKILINVLSDSIDGWNDKPDSERIHVIDDGDYQGTLVFVIAETGYQPSVYWATTVSYGSCSGCDTLEAIKNYDDSPPSRDQIEGYMTLALHLVQNMKRINEDWF